MCVGKCDVNNAPCKIIWAPANSIINEPEKYEYQCDCNTK